MEPFSMLITHCSMVQSEEKVEVKKGNWVKFGAPYHHNHVTQHTLSIIEPVYYQGSQGILT